MLKKIFSMCVIFFMFSNVFYNHLDIQTLRAFRLAKLGRLEAWRLGLALEAWKFGGLEAWKDSAVGSVEIRPQGFQNGTPGPPKWSSWASKMGPGASKMAPSWSKIDQDGGLEGLRHPKRAKQTPGKRPGRAPGSQNGSQGAPGHPKSSKNGAKMGSKWGPKPVQNGIRFEVPKNVDF